MAVQVLAQLKKFARTVKSVREAVKPPAKGRGKEQLSLGDVLGDFKRPNANMDLSEMLRTDIKGMDATVTGLVPPPLPSGCLNLTPTPHNSKHICAHDIVKYCSCLLAVVHR